MRKKYFAIALSTLLLSSASFAEQNLETRLALEDLTKVENVVPTSYGVVNQRNVPCKGAFRGKEYTGEEQKEIKDLDGNTLATICAKFYTELLLQGSGVLEKGDTIRYIKKVDGEPRFALAERKCLRPQQDRGTSCLIPFYSIAADISTKTTNHWKIGDILYVPDLKKLRLPNGSYHEGFLVVSDTGAAFFGRGTDRIDLFVGDSRYANFAAAQGFHHARSYEAYKVEGASKEEVEKWMRTLSKTRSGKES